LLSLKQSKYLEFQFGVLVPPSDVFSFAVLVQECFSRRNPLVKAPALEEAAPVAVPMPSSVVGIVTRCQARNPLERPDFFSLQTSMRRLSIKTVGAAFVKRGQEGRRQDRVLEQVRPL
jgi:hypothetical protein